MVKNSKFNIGILIDNKLSIRKKLLKKHEVKKGTTILIKGMEIIVDYIDKNFLIVLEKNSSFFTVLDPICILK